MGPNCAISDPGQILGFGCGNGGTGTCGVARQISGGDTLYILGDNGSSQASYFAGYNGVSNSDCGTSYEYDCTWGNVPAGTFGAPTQIIGTGNHLPRLYSTTAITYPYQILNVKNDYINLTNLEITETGNCTYNNPVASCRYSDGISASGNGQVWSSIYIHGVSRFGVVTGTLGSATYTNLHIIGSGYGGFTVGNNDSSSVTGTLTFNQPIIEWSGCAEAYPVTGGIDNPSNYSNCFGENNGGYGDGLAFGPSGSQNAGTWYIYGPGSISYNTQDGWDNLHGTGNGAMKADKMLFAGNAGQQVKVNGTSLDLTNSVLIGNCGWWYGASQTASGDMLSGDSCRANGDTVLFNVTNNSVINIFNNTLTSNGSIALESKDVNSTGCNGNTAIHLKNNIVYGGYWWNDDTTWNGAGGNALTAYIYNDGNDGNGGGTCGNLTWDEDYNIVTGFKNSNSGCVGGHDKCGTSPGFTGSIPTGTSGGGASTYYQGQSGVTLVPITSGSAAKGSGVSGLTYWNTVNDYYNNARPSISMGALEYGSLAAGGFSPCFFNSDCSSNSCLLNICQGSSMSPGEALSGQIKLTGNISFK